MQIPKKCIEETNDPIKSPSEKGKSITIKNPTRKTVRLIQIDDCAITKGERCDMLIEVDCRNIALFVEFKGGDIKHAISQLRTTICSLNQRVSKKEKIAVVIAGKTNPSIKTYIQKAKAEFKTKLKTKLLMGSKVSEHHL